MAIINFGKNSGIRFTTLAGVLAASFCVLVFLRLNLSHSSQSAIEQFSQQNRFELASADMLQLATKLNALTASNEIQCVFGKYRLTEFVNIRKGGCETGLTVERIFVKSSVEGLEIAISYRMPSLLIYSALALILSQILFISFFFRLHLEKIRLAGAAKEELASLATQVAHDIRSPLSALNLAATKLETVDQARKEVIQAVSERINSIADDLLNRAKEISKREDREKSTKLRTLDLLPLITAIVEEIKIKQKRIEFVIHNSNEKIFGVVNKSDFQRIISNLLTNAVDACEGIKGCVTLSIGRDGRYTRVVISDNGKGIPPEILEKIGTRGFSYDKKDRGNGLGVYDAKQKIESWGGRFSIASVLGKETRIILDILPSPP